MTDYTKLEALAKAATLGKWKSKRKAVSLMRRLAPLAEKVMYKIEGPKIAQDYEDWGFQKHDAAYIAAASPDVVLALLAERDALQGEVARLQRALINAHNNGANWSCQKAIREALGAAAKEKP